jgi:hypothetical protein
LADRAPGRGGGGDAVLRGVLAPSLEPGSHEGGRWALVPLGECVARALPPTLRMSRRRVEWPESSILALSQLAWEHLKAVEAIPAEAWFERAPDHGPSFRVAPYALVCGVRYRFRPLARVLLLAR